MQDLWTIGIPILIADVANPVLLAVVILALTAERPFAISVAVIAGHMAAYFSVGLLILFGLADLLSDFLEPLAKGFENPVPSDYLIGLLIGILLVVVAWRWKVSPPDPQDKEPVKVKAGVPAAFAFGAVVNFVGIPFALPYFAFINELYPLADADRVWALLLYNTFYAIPFLLVPASVALFGKSVMPLLQRVNQLVEKYSAYIIPGILGLLGLALIADAGMFLGTGTGLF